MPFLNHFNFESNTAPYIKMPTSDIRTSCSVGNIVIVNGWFTDANVPIFNVDSVSIHCDIYKGRVTVISLSLCEMNLTPRL